MQATDASPVVEGKKPTSAMYLGECPTYYPTEEEFADPTHYIQMIRPHASRYGLCKIVPPQPAERFQGPKRFGFREALQQSFSRLNPKDFKFKTKVQKIHQLQSRYGPNEAFLQDLHRFLNKRGTPMKTIPRLDGKELDLYKLFKIVVERGGAKKIQRKRKWIEVVEALKLSRSSKPTALAQLLAHQYNLWLSDYEEHYRRCVAQKHKTSTHTATASSSSTSNGNASSPSMETEAAAVGEHASPLKRKRDESDEELDKKEGGEAHSANGKVEVKPEGEANGSGAKSAPSSGGAESPAGSATSTVAAKYAAFSCKRCNKSIHNSEEAITEHLDYHYARDMASGCSMPNSNLASIVPRYILQGKRPKKESSPPAVVSTSSLESSLTAISPTHGGRSKNKTKRRRKISMNVPIFNDPVASFSYFSSQIKLGKQEDDESDASAAPGGSSSSSDAGKGSKGSNRSRDKSRGKAKKNKKQKLDDEDDEEEMDVESIMCTTCGGGEDEENMLLCDGKGCENAYHLYCLSIPISSIPVGDWFCDECLQAKREEDDKKRRIAAGEKIEEEGDDDDWHEEFGFGEGKVFTLESFKKMADNFKRKWFRTDNPDSIAVAQAEEEFWRIVNTCEEYVQVHYGSDLCTSAHGSGFPEPTGLPELDCGWNPRVLATVKGSPLRFLGQAISGITIPMVYVGMCFSSFCWHNEDNYLYSINYLHEGAPKSWYGVPGAAAANFERVMRLAVPDLFEEMPDLLHQLITMLSPSVLIGSGVPVYHLVQYPGDMIITFPQAYHAGFNHGYNVAESVNFATPDWLPFGRRAMSRYRKHKRGPVFSHQELICKAVTYEPESAEMGRRVRYEFLKMAEEEQKLRDKIVIEGIETCMRMTKEDEQEEDCRQCSVCLYDCYLSAVTCACKDNKQIVCLRHSKKLCACEGRKKVLMIRYTLAELDAMQNKYDLKLGITNEQQLLQMQQAHALQEQEEKLQLQQEKVALAVRP